MKELEDFLTGRIWLKEFAPFLKDEIDRAIAEGLLTLFPGISDKQECSRCLEKSANLITFYCAKCEGDCLYCRHCLKMGRISSCTELITWANPSPRPLKTHSFQWSGHLTPSQRAASQQVIESIQLKQSYLIYAVCGAGKTEVLFAPIHEALKRGDRICIAAPRTDVVLELSPRIRAVFPNTAVHTLYGGSPAETGFAEIIIATTHQLYRFQDTFDLMIVDEADAFPYSYDPALKRAVMKAKKQQAPIVFVSATPSARLMKNTPGRSEIFSRYHGHPLPVPRFDSLWNYRKSLKKNKIPKKLEAWIRLKLSREEPFLLFFPTIELIEESIALFKELDSGIEAVHSKDPKRKEKVMGLRQGRIPGVLTSTILERGITIPNVQVAVIGADEEIFNASALIQISGRAGRSADFPTGDVVFFHNGLTRQMDRAKKTIMAYNKGRNS